MFQRSNCPFLLDSSEVLGQLQSANAKPLLFYLQIHGANILKLLQIE